MKKKINKMPKFKNRDEEAKFWDTHSFADYWDDFKEVDIVVDLQKPKEETLVLRLQKGLKGKLARIARKKGLSTSSLTRMWLMEKLQANRVL